MDLVISMSFLHRANISLSFFLCQFASFFRLFVKHISWLDENKKSLEEALQSVKNCQEKLLELQ